MLALQGREEVFHPQGIRDETLSEDLKRLPYADRRIWEEVSKEERAAKERSETTAW